MRIKKIWVIVGVALVFIIFAFSWSRTKGILVDQKTGKKSPYSLEILKQKNIKNEQVVQWFKKVRGEKTTEAVYYSLKNTAYKGLDMHFYIPNAQEVMGDVKVSNVKVIESGTAVKVIIDTDKKTKHKKASTDLILHIYLTDPKEKKSAKMVQFIINGQTYFCINATFKDIK